MGLNDIQLPAAVLADLYHSSLVLPGEESPGIPEPVFIPPATAIVKEPLAETGWKYLGNNQQQILILVDYPGVLHLPDEELAFLTSMLAACKLGLGDVAILNRQHYMQASPKEFISFFKSRVVFLFGIEPAAFGLPVSFPQFQVQPVARTTFLYTPELAACREDKLLKSKLWVCLQRIFTI